MNSFCFYAIASASNLANRLRNATQPPCLPTTLAQASEAKRQRCCPNRLSFGSAAANRLGRQEIHEQKQRRDAAELDDVIGQQAAWLDLFLHKRTDLVDRLIGL